MTDSEKPEGDIRDADGVSVDEDGNIEVKMESLELSDGSDDSEEG
jgi:hypothetical protein